MKKGDFFTGIINDIEYLFIYDNILSYGVAIDEILNYYENLNFDKVYHTKDIEIINSKINYDSDDLLENRNILYFVKSLEMTDNTHGLVNEMHYTKGGIFKGNHLRYISGSGNGSFFTRLFFYTTHPDKNKKNNMFSYNIEDLIPLFDVDNLCVINYKNQDANFFHLKLHQYCKDSNLHLINKLISEFFNNNIFLNLLQQ